MKPCNYCKYSFSDLLEAAGIEKNFKNVLYSMSQEERNNYVKILCEKTGWYYTDIKSNNVIYTAFSPECEK